MTKVETELLNKSTKKPICWKRYVNDIFSLWNTEREEITHFIEQANNHHTLIKFTTEISENKVTFLYTIVCKGERFNSTPILDVRKHLISQLKHFNIHISTSCHPLGGKKGLIKGKAFWLLCTNSSKENFQKRLEEFQKHLKRERISSSLWNTFWKQERNTPTKTFKRKNHFALSHTISTISS